MTTSTKVPTSATGSDRFTKLLAFGQQKLTSLLEAIRSDTERGRTQRAALTVFFIRVISAAVAFASQVVLARWMGGHEYGIFVFVWVWVLILSVISSAGLNISMMRFLPQYTEEKKFGLLRGLLFGGRLITFGFACILTAMAIVLLYAFPSLVQSHYVLPAYIVLVCMPVIVLTDVQDCIGRAYSWMRLALIPPYILRPLLILISMCGAAVLGLPMEATTAAGCAVIACFLTYATQTVILQRRLKAAIPSEPRIFRTRFWLLTAFPILFVEGIDLLLYNADVLLISHFMSPNDVGIYFAALKTIGLVSFVHYAVGSSVANRIAAYKARGDTDQLETFIRDAAAWTFWPSLAGVIGLLILGHPLLWLFGPEFTAGYGVMGILAVGILIRAAVGPAEFVMNMMGEQNACAAVLGSSLVMNVLLNVALIPHFGLMGAAIATAFSRVMASVLFYIVARRRQGLDISILSSFRTPAARPAS